nr:venom peptide SjAPI-2-like [Plodia interpunctella]
MACSVYICLFALLATVYSQMMVDEPIVCQENEVYHRCVREVCHKTCYDMNHPPLSCPMLSPMCYEPGCICSMGFLRNKNGMCVRLHDCDSP